MSDQNDTIHYKINDILKDRYQDVYDITEVDFSYHIRSDITLDKVTPLLPNGRPGLSSYTFEGVLMAEKRIDIVDSNGLMLTRKETINYIKNDGTKSVDIVIKEITYNHADPDQGAIVIQERVDARGKIVGSIKAFLSGVMMQATQKSIPEVVAIIAPFWDDCEKQRLDFLEFGKPAWLEYLAAVDPATTPFVYLNYPINAQGVTVRQYMMSRLSY